MAHKLRGKLPGISLKAQLHLLIVLVAVFTFLVSLYISVQSTQQYLNTQMKSHAQDAATSLGLSMSAYMDDPDLVIAQTMVNAIFDSGYYADIEFRTSQNQVKIKRQTAIEYDEVPQWFVALFPLKPPLQSSEVNNGWLPAGVLSIQSNPGIAYKTLWHQARQSFYSIALIAFFSVLVIQWIVFLVLAPLRLIERQAREVSKKNFLQQDKLPFTTDLRSVVLAMNAMVANIQRVFLSLSQQADDLKVKVFTDLLTGLGNRRLLEQRFAAEQNEQKTHDLHLHMAMMSLHSLTEVHQSQGFQAADQYILLAVKELKQALEHSANSQLFRLGGSDFILLSQSSAGSLEIQLQQLSSKLKSMDSLFFPQGFASVALMTVEPENTLHHCLSTLDSAIIQRIQQPDLPLWVTDHKMQLKPEGRMAWHSVITALIQNQNFELWAQPVVKADQSVEYIETFVRFYFQHSQLSTTETYAMAEQQGLSVQLDQQVISYILNQIQDKPGRTYAINLSQGAVASALFSLWLEKQLKQLNGKVSLVFEVSEYSVLKAPDETKALMNIIKSNQCKVCIEGFGACMTSFKYLQGLDLDYVKIDAAYASALNDPENKFFIQTLCQICHGIGIQVLAPHIESEQMMDSCFTSGVNAVQGSWVLAPQKVNIQLEKSGLATELINLSSLRLSE
ncbi:EAL domain-containing protein [Rheinheimera sp. A13L]|uniref:bifunctional diguanylate cyclase/phosphodiesterase n=1 Tax=Rheinheimera sp. A13L TaxID=506534 RepID=UPI000212530C|nr:LapD/MoxY N-terminal periplasmic domain-containing protein [Rheinheimera sp. A13L]EGM78122.1 EAL domain-containing protein [Rheinheimera sp. A13L]